MSQTNESATRPTRSVHLGDPVPGPIEAYFTALSTGDIATAIEQLAARCLHATAPAEAIETAPRVLATGPEDIAVRLSELGHQHSEILLCLSDGERCLLEGTRHDGKASGEVGSFAANVWLDADGRISRYLEYSCPEEIRPAPTSALWAPPFGSGVDPDAFRALDRYFLALDESRFQDAADTFSSTTLYSHPPYSNQPDLPSGGRVEFRGRRQLYDDSFSRRSPHALVHRVLEGVQRGPHCIVEGIVEGLADGGTVTFLSSLTLDSDGLIDRYASWCSGPGVPR